MLAAHIRGISKPEALPWQNVSETEQVICIITHWNPHIASSILIGETQVMVMTTIYQ
jgi:hypothetical protein